MVVADVLKLVKENEVKFVDFRFTDTRGKEQHVSVPAHAFNEEKFTEGHAFDGSSIAGWKGIEASDFGKFAWVKDGEGNRIELWEPPKGC